METKSIFLSIFKKFNRVSDQLRPKLDLSDSELNLIDKNHLDFIKEVLISYSSFDIKRIFILVPYSWVNVDRQELKYIFKAVDTENYNFDAFYGVFLFVFDIVGLDMHNLLSEEIKFEKQYIIDFINEKKDILNNSRKTKSLDLKYIRVNEKILQVIRGNLDRIVS